jgi:hypothetical protein
MVVENVNMEEIMDEDMSFSMRCFYYGYAAYHMVPPPKS